MPETSVIGDVMIRRANLADYDSVVSFVKAEFGDRWLRSVHNGFQQTPIPIFIAHAGNQILGFACYDVVQMKKGVFGPMGTSLHYRQKGLGKALLHNCLSEMQRNGYAYAIIDNAGPLEFYESACGAVVIPKYYLIVSLGQANDIVERIASPHVGVVIDVYHVWWDPRYITLGTMKCSS
jgi:predicted N-acetyltransferase YhbS